MLSKPHIFLRHYAIIKQGDGTQNVYIAVRILLFVFFIGTEVFDPHVKSAPVYSRALCASEPGQGFSALVVPERRCIFVFLAATNLPLLKSQRGLSGAMYIPVEMMVHGHVGDDNVTGQENILVKMTIPIPTPKSGG